VKWCGDGLKSLVERRQIGISICRQKFRNFWLNWATISHLTFELKWRNYENGAMRKTYFLTQQQWKKSAADLNSKSFSENIGPMCRFMGWAEKGLVV
jgi:hypothetical protein